MTHAGDTLLEWLDSLPGTHGKTLAHLYRMCTCETISDMVVDPDTSLEHFRCWLSKEELPLRMVAKISCVTAVFDMLLENRHTMVHEATAFCGKNVIPLASLQWEAVLLSWKNLRNHAMSDKNISFWACEFIKEQKKQMGAY